MKRSPHLRQLSVEHQAALSLASRIERAVHAAPKSELQAFAAIMERRWHTELIPHFEIEERIWLPALAAAGLEPLAARTVAEHRALAAIVADGTARVPVRLARFAAALQAHVRFEERELFEAAQRALSEDQLAALARLGCG